MEVEKDLLGNDEKLRVTSILYGGCIRGPQQERRLGCIVKALLRSLGCIFL